jgi:hypothetical protein
VSAPTKCQFSTYGYACGKPIEHGHYYCDECKAKVCASCGAPATHGCDYCGQFVCGAPICDECEGWNDNTKSSGSWGFMNHSHRPKLEFEDKHRIRKLEAELSARKQADGA